MTQRSIPVDALIIGAGMVGLGVALGLAQKGQRVVVVAPHDRPQLTPKTRLRVSALNIASRQWLTDLAVWQHVDSAEIGPYSAMEVWDHDSFGQIAFAADGVRYQDLGAIVENVRVEQALWQQAEQAGVEFINSSDWERQPQADGNALLQVESRSYAPTVLIGADGARSSLRQQSGLPVIEWPYEQRGLVGIIETAKPHNGCCYQVFLPSGPLALLPLADPHQCSIVWSLDNGEYATVSGYSDSQLGHAIQAATGQRLGATQWLSERAQFPLHALYAKRWVEGNTVLVGDAAHSVHPLAGQGANLGLADAKQLVAALTDEAGELNRRLRAYERSRKTAAMSLLTAMEAFKRGFGTRNPVIKALRGIGFNSVNHLPSIKQKFMRRALGF
ncbi:ubiquinone biosynthesis protein UbiH [Idiomarina tyrosinivorans]|uniref:Ubiquinone biosynthesis protein UbiH n=1 Tax=Idiomarina tyrosinivorans TaxID=1445662 RepID=A0A432ZSB0_9GAMM|nr:FAD-dependent monooxygenase [Idiomarina tyrosinivorans]RUO80804.1 ubiquinone biosynthesis protein UbiH [Idiomarina tyrosinivorans]